MKRIIFVVTAFSLLFSAVVIADFYSFGRSVTMNLTITIGNRSVDSSGNYISAEGSGSIIALASKHAFGTRFDSSTGSMQMRLPLNNNRFFLVFTKGSNETIAEESGKIDELPQNRFGELDYSKPSVFTIFLRLEYYSLDLISKARFKAGELLIRNEDGISMEVIQ
jgi:hypothetical protein